MGDKEHQGLPRHHTSSTPRPPSPKAGGVPRPTTSSPPPPSPPSPSSWQPPLTPPVPAPSPKTRGHQHQPPVRGSGEEKPATPNGKYTHTSHPHPSTAVHSLLSSPLHHLTGFQVADTIPAAAPVNPQRPFITPLRHSSCNTWNLPPRTPKRTPPPPPPGTRTTPHPSPFIKKTGPSNPPHPPPTHPTLHARTPQETSPQHRTLALHMDSARPAAPPTVPGGGDTPSNGSSRGFFEIFSKEFL